MNFEHFIKTINASLQVGFFLLMGLGLLIGTVMLWHGKINGGDWTILCSVLFGADRASHALTNLRSRND